MPAPQPTKRVSTPSPRLDGDVVENCPCRRCDRGRCVSSAKWVLKISRLPSSLKSPMPSPMPACSMPSSFRATPLSRPCFGERAVVIVAEQQAGGGIAGDIDVRPAVVVEIRGHGGHPVAPVDRSRCPHALADIGERAVAVVVVQRERARAAGRAGRSSPECPSSCNSRFSPGLRHVLQIEIQVVRHEQIQLAVAVVVDESAARSPSAWPRPAAARLPRSRR